MTPTTAFQAFGASHLSALAATAVAGLGMIALARGGRHPALVRLCEWLLAVVLALLPWSNMVVQLMESSFNIQSGLPCHYCDLVAFTGALALWTHRQLFCEICYFFGLAGTLQGLLTPALQKDYPDPAYFYFFVGHGAVVIAALYVVAGLRRPPLPGAVKRAMIVMSIYALSIGGFDAVIRAVHGIPPGAPTGTNYGFLCYKSPNPSLLDYLGPWPWYIASLWVVGLLFYTILYLPFWMSRRVRVPSQ